MVFPVYRKRVNDKHYYRIDGVESFVELQVVGDKVFQFEFSAKIYPDKVMINDMLNLNDYGIVEISEGEYQKIERKIK